MARPQAAVPLLKIKVKDQLAPRIFFSCNEPAPIG